MQKIGNFLEKSLKQDRRDFGFINITVTTFLSSILLILLLLLTGVSGQTAQHTENKADQTLRGSGRVNPSTLGMEIEIPLGNYPGRGINVPISLSYSSKVWRMEFSSSLPGTIVTGGCRSVHRALYAENSASGWTTSLAVPYIEYVGRDNLFDSNGFPAGSDPSLCDPENLPEYVENAYLRRLTIHLPSGETHELRADDTVEVYPSSSNCVDNDPNTYCAPNDPWLQSNWNRTYYATDGSNIKYIEDSNTGTYRLRMPDGSFYDFSNSFGYMSAVRKAVKFTDRNGNFTSYSDQTGVWTDTLGRALTAPIGKSAPSEPTPANEPLEYSMPGMTGKYKFHWKRLKGSTAGESALTNFSQNLRYHGDKQQIGSNGNWVPIPAGSSSLFSSSEDHSYVLADGLFNPVVLTEIELPTGQSYKFTYDIHGRIERIYYPTGGEERFVYNVIAPLTFSALYNVSDQTNFGVTNRKLYPIAGQSANYEWNYSVMHVAPSGYKISTISPDKTINVRVLHRANDACTINCVQGNFGYDNGLAGMPYEELNFSESGQLVARKLTRWTLTHLPVWVNNGQNGGYSFGNVANWHPRVTHEESFIYDAAGNGVSATIRYEYEGDLSLRQSPVLTNKSIQYAFAPIENGGSLAPFDPDDLPDPNPTPVPIPNHSSLTPVRINESTYLINDPTIDPFVRDAYLNQNMIGLVTASVIKDGAETVVHRSETKFDDGGFSPGYRGNPTTARVWDSTKGDWNDQNAYLSTRARFDAYGNQYEAIDARGISTFTEFDSDHHAFPVKMTSAIPDPSDQHGSNTPFVTTAVFNWMTGLPLKTTDANGLETRIAYDPETLRPLNTKTFYRGLPIGTMSETIYHDEPNNYQVKSRTQIDADKWAETISYFDGLGRVYKAEEINSEGSIFVEKEFDAEGRVKRVTNPFRAGETKQFTTNVYDQSSRLREVILPDGARVKTDYGVSVSGAVGIAKTITDQAGKKRRGITDAMGRMIRVIEDPDGQNLVTDYVFDTLGNLRKTIQGEQNRFFTFDSLGRLLRAKQPEQEFNPNLALPNPDSVTGQNQWSVAYEYDDNGNITKTTDANNVSVIGTYDNLNRLKIRNYTDETPDVAFFYDGKYLDVNDAVQMATGSARGKTTGISSSVSKSNFTSFDQLGRLLASQQITDGKAYNSGYQYNLTSLVAETYPSGRTVSYEFNQDGDLARVGGTNGQLNRLYANGFKYNSSGAVEAMRLGNGRWETAKYNQRQQITEIGLGSNAADASLLKINYDYGTINENNGSLRQQRINFAGLSSEIKQTYTYDDLNRLKSATETFNNDTQQSWKQTFKYDRYGNRSFEPEQTTTFNPALSWKANNPSIQTADNRLKKDQDDNGVNDYDYDRNGSVTLDAENKRFIYDAENRLKQFFKGTNNTNAPDAVYEYDGSGQRIKKKTADETVVFVYNASGTLIAEYSTVAPTNAKVSYLTTDHLGSPRIITDGMGKVVSRHDYLSFGDEVTDTLGNVAGRTPQQGYGAEDEIRKQYTGYERDTESGLDYAQARYYNPKLGRFTSTDPLTASANVKDPQTFNRYSYAMNSPYKFIDPLGLISSSTGANGQNSETQNKPRRKKKKTPKRQVSSPPAPLTPDRTIVVPKNLRTEAGQATTQATLTSPDGNSSEDVTLALPNSTVELKKNLLEFAYTHQGAAANQYRANKKTGDILPNQGTISDSNTNSDTNSTTSSQSLEINVSSAPGLKPTFQNSDTTTKSTANQTGSQRSGPSTDITGIIHNIEMQANKAIVNYINANIDVNGNIIVEVVDGQGKKQKALWSKDEVKKHLTTFVQRIRNQADADFGGN